MKRDIERRMRKERESSSSLENRADCVMKLLLLLLSAVLTHITVLLLFLFEQLFSAGITTKRPASVEKNSFPPDLMMYGGDPQSALPEK